jgi:hypothetical protein
MPIRGLGGSFVRTETTLLSVLSFALAFVLLATDAFAQAPGPMSRAHRELNGPLNCNKCHAAGNSVPDDKCLACHTHQPLRARIRAKKGFHATDDVKSKACKDCHAEHVEEPPGSGKGRRTTIDWRPFGGKRNFNHRLTGWPLEGAHRYAKCEKCHDKKYPKSKLPTYLGARGECTTCHFGTKKKGGVGGHNPHEFTDVTLTNCQTCHSFANFKVLNLGATKFDHDKTAYPLVGRHLRNKCVECHEDIKTFKVKKDFSDCKGCHEDSHRSVISATRKCSSCHNPKTVFRKTRFDHGKETTFPLRGQHAKNRCKDCHKLGSKPEKPSKRCESCHEDAHEKRFDPEPCEGCHLDTGWKNMRFDHDKKTKFRLTGQHEKTSCTTCHRFGIKKRFERFKTTDCASCHAHDQAHCGQFGLENCQRCHVQGGDRTSKFDHAVTRFPLERAHAAVDCSRCHKPAKLGNSPECRDAVKYTGLDPQCAGCHVDIHKGELGDDCAKCHTSGENFKTLVFDHNADSRFPLTGFHQLVECENCHPGRKYKIEQIVCVDCHKKDDVHIDALGTDCAKCHETTGGAPKFEHDIHTEFELRGTHRRIECERCHFLTPDGLSYAEATQAPDAGVVDAGVGGADAGVNAADGGAPDGGVVAKAAEAKAAEAKAARILASTAEPGAPLDLQFRAAGKACDTCHPDPHKVRESLDCGSCHGEATWKSPPKNGYHERAGFALTGAHTVVACSMCHSGAGSLAGRGERCGGCHQQDDVHAGSLRSDCGRCHDQSAWMPTTFNHVDTGYVLQGLHRTLDCRQCHQAGNFFIGGQRCANCHLDDYRQSDWHNIDLIVNRGFVGVDKFYVVGGQSIEQESFECDYCHKNQWSWELGVIE